MSQNAWRWVAALGLAALGGFVEIASDAKFPGWWDLIRHMVLEMGPTALALRMTLTPKA